MTSSKKSVSDDLDSESEYEEEEATVLVELNGVIDSELLSQNSFERFHMIGIDTKNPILQINNYVFSGEYSEPIGTALFFEEDEKKKKKSDDIFSRTATNKLKYVDRAIKTLIMKRVFISEIKENSTENKEADSESNDCSASKSSS